MLSNKLKKYKGSKMTKQQRKNNKETEQLNRLLITKLRTKQSTKQKQKRNFKKLGSENRIYKSMGAKVVRG